MNHADEPLDEELVEQLRGRYNPPPEPPREAMWRAVRDGLRWESGEAQARDVGDRPSTKVDARRRAVGPGWMGWAVAAAALLVLGIGLGRMTVPVPTAPGGAPGTRVVAERSEAPLQQAVARHLAGTETFVALVRSDARSGELSPELRGLARPLLIRTRLFLDAISSGPPELRRLMEDVELVLAQVVNAEAGSAAAGAELDLALDGLDRRELLPRIQSWAGSLAGT